MTAPLILLGASVRAAAFSARRANFTPWCIDLFADADLSRFAELRQIEEYPGGFLREFGQAPDAPWLYTGGLENHPAVIDELARTRPLLGNAGHILERVRDPVRLHAVLQRAGWSVPACRLSAQDLPHDGSWLCKRRDASGGWHVHELVEPLATRDAQLYFQQRIAGPSIGAVYVAGLGGARLLGVTQQLIGCEWLGGAGFAYCGSVGPMESAAHEARLQELGTLLAREFYLQGLFGVDCIANRAGIWPLEVNPRYTASIEVLERSCGISAVALHVAACRQLQLPPERKMRRRAGIAGKAILYAREDTVITASVAEGLLERAASDPPELADIPRAGTQIPAGSPIMTLFAAGESVREVKARLRDGASHWYAVLKSAPAVG